MLKFHMKIQQCISLCNTTIRDSRILCNI